MAEIIVELDEGRGLDLHTIDVGVADDTIAFDVEGIIQGLEDSVLDDLRGKSLTPTEIHFEVAES